MRAVTLRSWEAISRRLFYCTGTMRLQVCCWIWIARLRHQPHELQPTVPPGDHNERSVDSASCLSHNPETAVCAHGSNRLRQQCNTTWTRRLEYPIGLVRHNRHRAVSRSCPEAHRSSTLRNTAVSMPSDQSQCLQQQLNVRDRLRSLRELDSSQRHLLEVLALR